MGGGWWAQGDWGRGRAEVPQRGPGPGAEPRWGLGAKTPEARYIQTICSCQMLFYAGLLSSPSSIYPSPSPKKLRICANLITHHAYVPIRAHPWLYAAAAAAAAAAEDGGGGNDDDVLYAITRSIRANAACAYSRNIQLTSCTFISDNVSVTPDRPQCPQFGGQLPGGKY